MSSELKVTPIDFKFLLMQITVSVKRFAGICFLIIEAWTELGETWRTDIGARPRGLLGALVGLYI